MVRIIHVVLEIKSFDTIVAAKVVDANEKLYIDQQEGFIGTGLKKAEFVQNCSDLDDVIIFYRDGKYKVSELPTRCLWVRVYFTYKCLRRTISVRFITSFIVTERQDLTISNASNVTSITRDKEYDVTLGTPGSRINYFTANPNGELS